MRCGRWRVSDEATREIWRKCLARKSGGFASALKRRSHASAARTALQKPGDTRKDNFESRIARIWRVR